MTFNFEFTGALAVKLFRSVRTVGAQNNFTESRSISVTGVTPNTKFGCGKYKHCNMLRDNKHGPDFLLNSMKKFYFKEIKFCINKFQCQISFSQS